MADVSSAMYIEQLTGPRRSIRLIGRGLPYKPLVFKSNQNVEITWYPGNETATSDVIGPTLDPTSVNGIWKDKFLSNGTTKQGKADASTPISLNGRAITTAQEAVGVFDLVRKEGQLLEVSFLNFKRRGFLTSFTFEIDNQHDIAWNAQFSWVSVDAQSDSVQYDSRKSVTDCANEARQNLNELKKIVQEKDFAVQRQFQDLLQQKLNSAESYVDQLDTAAANAASGSNAPIDTVRAAVGALNNISVSCDDLLAHITTAFNNVLYRQSTAQEFLDRINVDTYLRSISAQVQQLKQSANVNAQAYSANIRDSLLATHTATDGEDLRDVSDKYYKTPFMWRTLADYNFLTSSKLSAGQIVFVPTTTQVR